LGRGICEKDFVEGFALNLRPLLMTQEVKLLQAAGLLVGDKEADFHATLLSNLH
jgi:hypothetical protein